MYISESLAFQRVDYVRGRVFHVLLKGGCCSINILNLQTPIEDKFLTQRTVPVMNYSRYLITFQRTL